LAVVDVLHRRRPLTASIHECGRATESNAVRAAERPAGAPTDDDHLVLVRVGGI
jgi:hypothetical protein